MLKGEYSHNIDAKGRLIIPAKFRDDLGEHFVITKGMENCLYVYPEAEWTAFEENLTHYQPPLIKKHVRLRISFREAQRTVTLISKAEL